MVPAAVYTAESNSSNKVLSSSVHLFQIAWPTWYPCSVGDGRMHNYTRYRCSAVAGIPRCLTGVRYITPSLLIPRYTGIPRIPKLLPCILIILVLLPGCQVRPRCCRVCRKQPRDIRRRKSSTYTRRAITTTTSISLDDL